MWMKIRSILYKLNTILTDMDDCYSKEEDGDDDDEEEEEGGGGRRRGGGGIGGGRGIRTSGL